MTSEDSLIPASITDPGERLAWRRGYQRNPIHEGSMAARSPHAREWPALLEEQGTIACEIAYLAGYEQGMW